MLVSDENYIPLMKQGDESALEYFIEKDGWIVKSIICRAASILPDERQDVMNDVFFTVWRNVGKYEESRASFTTWLAGVTRYGILNFLKRRERIEYLTLEEIWEQPDESDVESTVFIREEKEEFQKLLKHLPLLDQKIFLKLFWEEKSYEEICGELNLEKAYVYNRVSRGKRKLRSFFTKGEVL